MLDLNYKKFIKLGLVILTLIISFSILARPLLATSLREKMISKIEESGIELGRYEDNPPEVVVGNIVKVFLSFMGVIFLGLMVYGGYIWMTARGNEEKVTQAKNLIISAIIGLTIIIAAYVIATYVTEALQEATTPTAE